LNFVAWKPCDVQHKLHIGECETHVWLLSCALTHSVRTALWRTLDDGERDRAGRFYFDVDRERFVARSGALRQLLSGYVGVSPQCLKFSLGPHGKPRLLTSSAEDIEFNSSSSGEWAMVAVSRGREVGVDIERIDAARSDPDMASHFFAPGELRRLDRLDGDRWTQGFFNCWARKEAFLKSTGEGLSRPLDSFEVSLEPGEPAHLVSADGDSGASMHWHMTELEPIEGYAHALVVAGEVGALRGLRWQSEETGGYDDR
jgi:4'-phosphopantetheinyl transferase